MDKILHQQNIQGKTKLRIDSANPQIDFLKESIQVLIYFNPNGDLTTPSKSFLSNLYIYEQNQKMTTVFDVPIPVGTINSTVIFSTKSPNVNLDLIRAEAIN